MRELRKNNIVHIESKDGTVIDGFVAEYESDRVLVRINDTCIDKAKKFSELDDIVVCAETVYGMKTMYSCVLSELNNRKCMVIENADAVSVDQKRDFVRAVDNFPFDIDINGSVFEVVCKNISGSGAAFLFNKRHLRIGQTIKLIFPAAIFEREIVCEAEIVKVDGNLCAVSFGYLNEHDQNKIMKRIFKLLAQK